MNGRSHAMDDVSKTELAEVFLHLRDGRLVAFEASAPDKGFVTLGELPAMTHQVHFNGLSRRPHRLVQVFSEYLHVSSLCTRPLQLLHQRQRCFVKTSRRKEQQ